MTLRKARLMHEMKLKTRLLLIFFFAVFFTAIFYRQGAGLNVLIAEIAFLLVLMLSKEINFHEKNVRLATLGFILSGVFTVITHSHYSYFANLLSLILFTGVLIYPEAKSWLNSLNLSIYNGIKSQFEFLSHVSDSKIIGSGLSQMIRKARIIVIPLIIILVFIILYAVANPIFGEATNKVLNFLGNIIEWILKNVNVPLVFTYFFFVAVSNFLFIRVINKKVVLRDALSVDEILRKQKKNKYFFKLNGLKNEYKAGIFLFSILNILLLSVNIIDINWVWFNFEWEGQYLKEFVHHGTYILIISILISIGLVLYFFKGNLNFYSGNKLLRILCYFWILQNTILTISVTIRNIYYVEHFNLAYKRIGVFIFIIMTLYGLFTVFQKVRLKKSNFFVYRKNTIFIYITLIFFSFFNWDNIIAKYNFAHADRSFLHLNYMATLSDHSLPLLDKPLPDLTAIDSLQKKIFPFERIYLDPASYHEQIQSRIKSFKLEWEQKNFLSWNLPEYLAYKKLTK
jgi:hypothetical protein